MIPRLKSQEKCLEYQVTRLLEVIFACLAELNVTDRAWKVGWSRKIRFYQRVQIPIFSCTHIKMKTKSWNEISSASDLLRAAFIMAKTIPNSQKGVEI